MTVSNGTIAGDMTGAGDLTVTGGTVTVSGSGSGMTAKTTIDSDGTIRMLSADALGSGDVDNQGLLALGESSSSSSPIDYKIGSLSNSGTVNIGHNDATGNAVAGTTLTVNGNYTGNGGDLLIERFNRTYRTEILDFYLFRTLNDVREIAERWLSEYNCARPYESLNNMTPEEYRLHHYLAGISTNAWNQNGSIYTCTFVSCP